MSNPVLHIYTRVSSVAQEDLGSSLQSQLEAGEKRAELLGYDTKLWNEGGRSSASETLDERPVLMQLLAEVEEGNVKNLFVYAMDRLSRNDMTSMVIKHKLLENDVRLFNPSGEYDLTDPQSKLTFEIMAAFASYDNALRAERSRQGKLQKVRTGTWLGGPPPFGYKLVDKRLSVNEYESSWVKSIFEWYLSGDSVRDISAKLMHEGVRTRRNNSKWSLGSLTALMSNTHYIGYYIVKDHKTGEEIRCECPPIIDEELYINVHSEKEKRSQKRIREPAQKNFYTLKGLLRCGSCGSMLAARNSKKQYRQYYYCPRNERNYASKSKVICENRKSLKLTVTDSLVWSNVVKSLIAIPNMKDHPINMNFDLQEIALMKKKLGRKLKNYERDSDSIKDQLARLEVDLLLGKREKSDVVRIRHVMNDELENVSRKIESTIDQIERLKLEKAKGSWWQQFFISLKDLRMMSEEQRREFLFKVLEKIDVTGSDDGGHILKLNFRVPVFEHIEPWEKDLSSEHLSPNQMEVRVGNGKKN